MSSGAGRTPPATGLALGLYALAAAVGFAVFVEWPHYRTLLRWTEPRLRPWDDLVVLWALVAKSLWLLAPPLLVAAALARWGRRRAAWTLTLGAGTAVFVWLTIDLRVHAATRNHAADYLGYLAGRRPWEWVGGARALLATLLGLAMASVLAQLAGAWGLDRFARQLAARRPPAGGAEGALVVVLAYGVTALGVVPATVTMSRPLLLRELDAALPVSLPVLLRAGLRARDRGNLPEQLAPRLEAVYRERFPRLGTVGPAGEPLLLPDGPRPHLLLVVVESLRHDALDPRWMPRTQAWSRGGLRLERHYSASNVSHLGLFALLHGRHPLRYHVTLDAGAPPLLPLLLRRAGYRTAYLASGTVRWARMEEYVNDRVFDLVAIDEEGPWPERDRRIFWRAGQLLADRDARPWFVVLFPASTHFDYQYPPEYARHAPALESRGIHTGAFVTLSGVFPLEDFRRGLLNRYRNALGFVDDLVADLVTGLDPARHLVVLTGDHGQSFFEDGAWTMGGPLSDAQTRVPMVLRGPGIPAATTHRATSHVDLLPTLVHALAGGPVTVPGAHGRNLLGEPIPDQVLLARLGHPARLLLIRGEDRLEIRLALETPAIHSLGFVDVHARPLPADGQPAASLASWAAAFAEELDRLGR